MDLYFTLFAQQLPNNSFNDWFFQTAPLRDVTLICGYWSDFIWSGVCELSAALCTTIIGETAIYNAPKAVPSGKEWISIFIQTNTKIKFPRSAARNKWAGNILMFHVDVNGLGFVLKMTPFNDSETTLSFETWCTFRFKTLKDVFIHLELCYTLH